MSAYFHLVKAAIPHLGKGASIIGSSSVNSDSPNPTLAPYAAAKAAVAAFTRSLAQELAPQVNVNCVAPGLIQTSVTDRLSQADRDELTGRSFHKRAGQPREVANAVAFLASDEARFLTGEVLAVSGGYHPHL